MNAGARRNYLTYPRDHRGIVGKVLGPSYLGEFWRAVSADYDGSQTRVGFVLVPRSEVLS